MAQERVRAGFVDIAKGDFGRIVRLCYHLDDLQSRLSKAPRLKRRRMASGVSSAGENQELGGRVPSQGSGVPNG